MIRVVLLLVLLVATARAATPERARTLHLPLPECQAAHEKLADEAKARGDREAEAAHAIEACQATLFLTFNAKAPQCVRAELVASALPTTYMLARLRASQAGFVAWSLDWPTTRFLLDEAARLGKGGPAADTHAGDALRVLHLVRGGMESEAGNQAGVEAELDTYLTLARAAGDRAGIAQAYSFLCRYRWRTGLYVEAAADCERGLVEARAIGDDLSIGSLLWNRGAVERDRGDFAKALATWKEGIDAGSRGKAPVIDITVRNELAALLVELGRFDEAQRHLDHERAVLAAGLVPPAFGFQLDWVAGSIALGRGDARGAIELFRKAQSSPIDSIVTTAYVGEASARHQLGELAEAEAAYRTAIQRIETTRAGVTKDEQRAGFMQRQIRAYQELVSVLWDRHGAGAASAALAVAESARARALLDALRAAGVESTPAAPLSPSALQQRVPIGSTLVLYVATKRRLFGFAVTRERIAMTVLPGAGTRDQLAPRVDLYRQLLATVDDRRELDAPGTALHADLLAPLSPTGALVIAADGPLHLLPFDALVRDGRFLVETTEVTTTPSGSLLTPPSASSPDLFVLAGPPVPAPLAPLLASRDEVDAVQTVLASPGVVLTGTDATEARFRSSGADRLGVLHFATHAVIDDQLPLRSGLLVAPGTGVPDDDGWLRAAEIYRLSLRAALVVLSGCKTGAGHVSASEGPMSLARAFLHAGARSVIATMWDLEDRYAPSMASALYRELASGAPIRDALARAKRTMIDRGLPPRAWAPWVAIGPPETTTTLAPASPPAPIGRYLVIALAVVGVLALAAAFVLGRR